MILKKSEGNIDVNKSKLNAETMKIRINFIDDLLASCPADEELYRTWLAQHGVDPATIDDEIAHLGIDDTMTKGKTIFLRNDDGEPCIRNYQVRGFFKNACRCLKPLPGTYSSDIVANKAVIDRYVFVQEKYIPIHFDGEISDCQRPLRASTLQGERVALSVSESAPAGSWIECTVISLYPGLMDAVREWLAYGQYNGLCQWRNSGKGSFLWEELDNHVVKNLPEKKHTLKIGKKMNDDN